MKDNPKFKIGQVVMDLGTYGDGKVWCVGRIISMYTYDRIGKQRWTYIIQLGVDREVERAEGDIFACPEADNELNKNTL